jgi:hypothetical protein
MAGTPQKRQDTYPLQITIPVALHRYVQWLAANSFYGPTDQDVILKIVTAKVEAMFAAGFHEKRIPGPAEASAIDDIEPAGS